MTPTTCIELRCRMMRRHVDQIMLATAIGKSPTYVCSRINGRQPWTMTDVYKICDILHIPYSDIPFVFPPIHRHMPYDELMIAIKGEEMEVH